MATASDNAVYADLSRAELIQRVAKLEDQLRAATSSAREEAESPRHKIYVKPKARPKPFDSTKYSTRHVALKVAYLGKNYNGFEHHANNVTPRPTVEEELWKAMTKTRLIFPDRMDDFAWDGCEYSKSGRTDKGVSAFGQVIGVRVRSNRPKIQGDQDLQDELSDFDEIKDELPYPRILNRVLPPDIKVLAWCPSPPTNFSARFSCRERRYRYFFTQPAFLPLPGCLGFPSKTGERIGWLDIAAMREAARLFEGVHDFRNFCKIDPARQITNYQRQMFYSDIEEVPNGSGLPGFLNHSDFRAVSVANSSPMLYSFTLHGSAFLWHQVRCMVAILFLVGQGLEEPSIVKELLDISKNPCKPKYEMANEVPLVLWDSIFPTSNESLRKDSLLWVYPDSHFGSEGRNAPGMQPIETSFGPGGILKTLWSGWREKKLDELLAGALLEAAAETRNPTTLELSTCCRGAEDISARVFDGDNSARQVGTYTSVMSRERMETSEALNRRYAERKNLAASKVVGDVG